MDPATDAGGRPWRWDHEWRIGPPCADRDGLPALLDPAIARWSSSSGWAYRIEVPIAVSPQAVAARGLELWVVDPGRVRVELEAAGAAGPSTSSDALDAALDRRLDAATAALAPLGLVAVDWGGGSSHGGAVTSARRHRDVWFAPGTDLAGLDAAAIANRVTVDRIDRPARWVGFVVLAEPDPAAAERALRVAVPEATAIGPWGGPW
ncbi:MAG: hypothetical protein ABMB14_09705 [Myxococcota bacterium]